MDGKTVRGSRDTGCKHAIHMVSARASAHQLSLGQVKVDGKSSEITSIPKLLDALVLKDYIVTMDAMGCRREIADKIISKEADYILAVKGNQGILEENIEDTVRFTEAVSHWSEDDLGHGRIENRQCYIYKDLSFIENASRRKSLSAVVKVASTRYIKSTGKEEKQIRFYITSSDASAEVIGKAVRSYREIENKPHRHLDVSFSEDQSRKRDGDTAQNFSLMNRITLNLLKNEQSKKKRSVKGKRLTAGWDNDYLLKILKN
jgi:predicted transposase YbfD/YdcC